MTDRYQFTPWLRQRLNWTTVEALLALADER